MKLISWPALVLLAVIVAGYVALALGHVDTGGYDVLVGPVVAAVLVTAKLAEATNGQNVTLGEIHENTNGKLTERLQTIVPAAVEDVLVRHGVIPAASTPVPAAPPTVDPPAS